MPDILKCFSQRPDFLKSVIEFSESLHFADGHLTRRTKEMIATLVSGIQVGDAHPTPTAKLSNSKEH